MIDELQEIRMLAIWPVVVGSTAFLLMRLALLVASPIGRVGRAGAFVSVVIGVVSGAVAMSISRSWNNSYGYWLAFTIGLAALAVVMVMTVAMIAAEDASHGD